MVRLFYKIAQLGVLQRRLTDDDYQTERPIPHYRRNLTGKPNEWNPDSEYLSRLLLREFPLSNELNILSDRSYSNEFLNG